MMGRMILSLALVIGTFAPAFASAAGDTQTADATKPALDVIMYSTATCPYCEKARQWFTSHKVAWDERDVEKSATARTQWQEMGGVGTPMIVINGKRFNGFMEGALEAEIAKYR